MNTCRVLISSVSAKVPMVEAVRKGFEKCNSDTVVVGADCVPDCRGRTHVDEFIRMEKLNELDVQDFVKQLHSEGITHIIPSRDGELLFYANNKSLFLSNGMDVMISEPVAISDCLDKLRFYQHYGADFPIIPTYENTNMAHEHWVVKERLGAASVDIALNVSTERAKHHGDTLNSPIYQPFIAGIEFSVDMYLTKSGECIGCVVRSRDHVVYGESKVTTSRERPDIAEIAIKLAKTVSLQGHVLVQIIEDDHGGLHIVEINPRYGGASGLSVALGLDSFQWFARESAGECLTEFTLKQYAADTRMIKNELDESIIPYES